MEKKTAGGESMILLINICNEKLHELEFVKPIEDILKMNNLRYFVKSYKTLQKKDLLNAKKIIICGTSLRDNEFVKNIEKFNWLVDFNKPILGVCGGMQVIGIVFGGKLLNGSEIGFYFENFKKEFLGLKGKQEVFHLHNHYVNFGNEFERFTDGKIPQAVKHNKKEIYGVLFHPEVRQKDLFLKFINTKFFL